jgi:hypothetical protein
MVRFIPLQLGQENIDEPITKQRCRPFRAGKFDREDVRNAGSWGEDTQGGALLTIIIIALFAEETVTSVTQGHF